MHNSSSTAPGEHTSGEHADEKPVLPSWLGHWVPRLYIAAAVALIPWDTYLALSLPERQISPHYRGSWVIYDAVLCFVLGRIGWLAHKRNPKVVLAAAAGAALLFADAWFDVSSAYGNDDHIQALCFAVFLELPGAYLCSQIALRALRHIARQGLDDSSTEQPSNAPESGTP